MKLGLISCAKSKVNYPCKAKELYTASSLFQKALNYSEEHYGVIGILSAKYGFILLDEMVEPYDLTLKTMTKCDRKKWSQKVKKQLVDKLDLEKIDSVYFHAGIEYREDLIPFFRNKRITVVCPLEGLSLGRQLSWYNNRN